MTAASVATRPARGKYDWEAIEREYRTGKYSLVELQNTYGPHFSTICKRAQRYKWTQDLSEAVRVATQVEIARKVLLDEGYTQKAQESLRETVEATAQINAGVALSHRKQLAAMRGAMTKMVDELVLITDPPLAPGVTIEDVAMVAGMTGKDTEALITARTLGYRVQVADKLSAAMARTIQLERQIHGLDAVPEEQTFEGVMAKALASRTIT